MALGHVLTYHPQTSAWSRQEVTLSSTRALILTGSPRPSWAPALNLSVLATPTAAVMANDAAVRQTLLVAREAGARAVTLSGGEVLTRTEILDWIALARQLGFQAIELRTMGAQLSHPKVAAQLVRAGATHISIPLLSHRAEGHDHLRAQRGAFALALRGLRAAREGGARTRVLIPLLRPTYHTLPALVRRSLTLGVSGFEFIALPGPDRDAHPLLPHPALVAPKLQAAIHLARSAHLRARTWLVPLCLLGPYADSALETRGEPPLVLDAKAATHRLPAVHFERKLALSCETCTQRTTCRGPLRTQLERYGERWLSPLPPKGDPALASGEPAQASGEPAQTKTKATRGAARETRAAGSAESPNNRSESSGEP